MAKPDPSEATSPEAAKSKEPKEGKDAKSGNTVDAVLPEDVLSKKELEEGVPERKDWNAPSDEVVSVSSSGTSAGTIPAVKPFNFGRDPGGPEDKTLYLGLPRLGLEGVPVYNSTSEEELMESTVHVPATGFPWQEGANVYIAGHRLGYPNTGSFRIFYELDQLAVGDEITLQDAAGGTYVYRVTETAVVGPDNVEVMNPVEGKSVITLQTCTLPDYSERVIVRGELVEKSV